MIHETIPIHGGTASLVTYIHDRSEQSDFQRHNRPAIIVLPGGAYAYLSDAEGEPVALTFLKEGFNAFVLRYSVGDACTYPEILEEVSLAVWTVRSRAAEWDIDPNAIVLMGFSSGGCLSAMSRHAVEHARLAERLGVPSGASAPTRRSSPTRHGTTRTPSSATRSTSTLSAPRSRSTAHRSSTSSIMPAGTCRRCSSGTTGTTGMSRPSTR